MNPLRSTFALAIAIVLAGCCSKPSQPSQTGGTSTPEQDEIDVLETAIRSDLLQEYGRPTEWNRTPIFIGIRTLNPVWVHNPPAGLMKRLSDLPMRVLSLEDRDTSYLPRDFMHMPVSSFREKGNSAEGILLGLRIIRWMSPTRVELAVGRSGLQSYGYTIRLVKSGGRWFIVEHFADEIS